jgi:hypothetical protein
VSSGEIYSVDDLEKYYRMRERKRRAKPRAASKPVGESKPRDVHEPKTVGEARSIQESKQESKPTETSKQEPKTVGEAREQPCGIDLWRGRRVRVHMRDGNVFEGLCKVVWRYEFLLDTGEKTIDIFKHAVEWVELLD